MKNFSIVNIVSAISLLILSSCATTAPVGGFLYSSVAGPVAATTQQLGTKHGQACATSYLGAVALGDASITAAAKNGGVANISHVDQHSSNILGIIVTYCTEVWGYAARPSPASVPSNKSGSNLDPQSNQQTADASEHSPTL